jgi:hypothetical protein
MSAPPLLFRWDGEAMAPVGRFAREADRHFVIGQNYRLEEVSERSEISHKHEFAWLREAWANLPESAAQNFDNEDQLRKYALIQTGWCNREEHVYPSKAEAMRQAATIRRHKTDYCIVVVRGCIVTVLTARSQKMRGAGSMSARDFQKSKTDIMEYVAGMIGIPAETLNREAGKAA